MGWKVPIAYRQRDVERTISRVSYTTKPLPKVTYKERHIEEELPQRTEVIKLKIKEAKNYEPCPRHGRRYLVKEGGAIYCFAETKGEMFDRCFYHVSCEDDENATS